ncbi:MAG: hypothetical protein U0869_14795 [Chloroflexota bacterium]
MQTEAATVIAVLAAPFAVVASGAALVVVMVARSGRRGLARARGRLDQGATGLEEELVAARTALERLGETSVELRDRGRTADIRIEAWTDDLARGRATIDGFSRGRLAPAIRAVQLASALARVALLWRLPAR